MPYTVRDGSSGGAVVAEYKGFSPYTGRTERIAIATFDGEADLYDVDDVADFAVVAEELRRYYVADYSRGPERIAFYGCAVKSAEALGALGALRPVETDSIIKRRFPMFAVATIMRVEYFHDIATALRVASEKEIATKMPVLVFHLNKGMFLIARFVPIKWE